MIPTMIAPSEIPLVTNFLVRHGAMRFLGEYTTAPGVTARRGDTVIVRSERGLEVADVLCPATPQAVAAIPEPTHGDILRVATSEDRAKIAHLRDIQKREF